MRSRQGRWWLTSGLALAVFAAAAWLLFAPLGLADSQHLAGCGCEDQALQIWFLAGDHFAAVHGHLPLHSDRLDYPLGVNFLDNTSMPLLGFLAGPLFDHVGPVGVFDLLMRAGFFLSAASAFLVLRRYVTSAFAAFAGAGLYAFGPFMSHQGGDHLFLVFVPLPPILVLLVEHRLRDPGRNLRAGVAFGVLAVAQYLISSETLVTTVVALAGTVVVLGVVHLARGRRIAARLRRSGPAAGLAAAIVVIGLAYPAWYAIRGPQHILGPTQPVPGRSADILGTVVPVTHTLMSGHVVDHLAWTDLGGDMQYLGVPLLVILAVAAVRLRRVPVVRFAAVLGALSWVLSLGPRLVIGTRVTTVPLPFALFDHVPILEDIVSGRFAFVVDLSAAIILAVAVDHLVTHVRRPGRAAKPAWAVAALAVAVIGVVPLLPAARYPVGSTGDARYFLDGTMDRYIPDGGVVLTYPYPHPPAAEAMIWAADAALRFRLLGGYAVGPAANPENDKLPALLAPAAPEELFLQSWPTSVPGARRVSLAAAAAALPDFVRRYHVRAIVVHPSGVDPAAVVALCRRVYGDPIHVGGLLVWSDLPR